MLFLTFVTNSTSGITPSSCVINPSLLVIKITQSHAFSSVASSERSQYFIIKHCFEEKTLEAGGVVDLPASTAINCAHNSKS